MGMSFNTIAFRSELCDGCGACMTACAEAKSGTRDHAYARLRVFPAATPDTLPDLALCRQCSVPDCATHCPAGALQKNATSGVVEWDAERCVDCLLCTAGCVYGGISYNPAIGHVSKCDTCEGDPACVRACSRGALSWRKAAEIYNTYGAREDLFVPGLSACQGCHSELLIRHTLRKVGSNVVVAAPPGCIPGMGTVGYNGRTGAKVPIFHPLLTNTAAMLSGLARQFRRQGREVTMLALAGDGGTADAGFHSLSGAAARNDPILYVCVDNEGYMNTGMQASGSTPQGSWTSTTPVGPGLPGKREPAKNLPLVMVMHECAYVATASTAFLEDYYEKLEKAIAISRRGFAYLHVYAPCPSGWRFPSAKTAEIARLGVETNFHPLWEFTPEQGLRFTRAVDRPRPVREYLGSIGKYRHLTDDEIAEIEAKVAERLAALARFAAAAPTNEAPASASPGPAPAAPAILRRGENARTLSDIETISRDALAALQFERLRAVLQRVYERVPLYREKCQALGLRPEDLRGLEDLALFPFSLKTDLRDAYPFGLFAVPRDEILRLHASSGTTGRPTVVGYTRGDLDIWAELVARSLATAGARPGDVIHNAYGYGLFTGGLGFHSGAERLGATVVPASGGGTERQVALLRDFGATVLCATPSYALNLAETAEREGIDLRNGKLRLGLFGAEPWSEKMRAELASRLGIAARDVYGLSEVLGPGVAIECGAGEGLHGWEDHFLFEIVDPDTGAVLPPGAVGELVVTTLTKEALPMIRYRTRDITRLDLRPCACGRTHARIMRITGRSDDMLIIRGVNIYPSQVEAALLAVDGASPHYQLLVERKGIMDSLTIRVEAAPEVAEAGYPALAREITHRVKSVIGISATIAIEAPGTLPRSEGKAARVRDLRPRA